MWTQLKNNEYIAKMTSVKNDTIWENNGQSENISIKNV